MNQSSQSITKLPSDPITRFIVPLFVVVSTIALSAHHTITTYYDPARHTTLKGVVEYIEWKEPHSFIHLAVADSNGAFTRWQIETQASNLLRRRNTELLNSIKADDVITVTVCAAKDGGSTGWLRELTTSAGTTFDLSGAGGC
jgi:hypothetical protein